MRPSALHAIAAGFVGTVAITLVMYWVAPLLIGMPMDIAKMLGDFLAISWTAGIVVHFINGSIIFPLIYAFVLYGVLPGSPVIKGLTWGVILWMIAQAAVMPMMGAGFFSANGGGAMAVIGSLLGHLIYGGILGAMAGGTETVTAAA